MKQRHVFDRFPKRPSFARTLLLTSLVTLPASTAAFAQSEPVDPPPAPPPYEAPSSVPAPESPPPGDAPPAPEAPTTGTFPNDPPTGSFPGEPSPAPAPVPRTAEPAQSPAPSPPPQAPAPLPPPPSPATTTSSYPSQPPPAPTTDWSVPEAAHDERQDDSNGLLGPFRIGPVLGVGMPNLIQFGGTMKLTKYFGAGLSIGVIPAITLSIYGEAELSYREYDIYARVYPFGGGFFLGAGIGYETVKGTITDSVNSSNLAEEYPELGIPDVIEYQADGRVRTMIMTPQIGYFFTAKSGFSLGLFLGAQFPIAPSEIEFETTVEGLPEVAIERYVAPLDKKVRDTLETVARQPLPSFGLQIGWLL